MMESAKFIYMTFSFHARMELFLDGDLSML